MKTLVVRSLAAALCVMTCGAKADAIMIEYLVEFTQSGDVMVGSTLDWTLSAVVSDSDAGNFGIRTASVDLVNSTGEVMSPGTVAFPFNVYAIPSGGIVGAPGELNEIGAGAISWNPIITGQDGNLGPHVLATGSYVVNTLGLHTLAVDPAASTSFYFTDMAMAFAAYDATITTSSDFVNVVSMASVPEPGSMLLASSLLFPGVIAVRRRRRQAAELSA